MYIPESPEYEMLRHSLRRFLERECPHEKVRQWDEEDYYPPELTAKMRELGIFGLTTPEEYGGAGRDILGSIITIEELSRGYLMTSLIYVLGAFYGAVNICELGRMGTLWNMMCSAMFATCCSSRLLAVHQQFSAITLPIVWDWQGDKRGSRGTPEQERDSILIPAVENLIGDEP